MSCVLESVVQCCGHCCCVCDRMSNSIHPVFVSVGNLPPEGNNTTAARRIVTFIKPLPRGETSEEDYRFCTRLLIQKVLEMILLLVRRWTNGFLLQLPGDRFYSHIVPFVGMWRCDLIEARYLLLTINGASARCKVVLDAKNPAVNGPQPEPPGVPADGAAVVNGGVGGPGTGHDGMCAVRWGHNHLSCLWAAGGEGETEDEAAGEEEGGSDEENAADENDNDDDVEESGKGGSDEEDKEEVGGGSLEMATVGFDTHVRGSLSGLAFFPS